MRHSNRWFLAWVIALAFVPLSILLLSQNRRSPFIAFAFEVITGLVWLVITVIYYRRVRTGLASLVFLLVPIALGPVIAIVLLFFGIIRFGH